MSRASRLRRVAIPAALAWFVLTACAPDVAESPHVSLLQLRRAVDAGDTTATLQYIDVDAIVARLTSDLVAVGRDSFDLPADDSLSTDIGIRLDSARAQWRAILRTQLGFETSVATTDDTASLHADDPDEDLVPADPSEDVLASGVEIVGDGAVRYVGDTALVERMLRYAYLDTSATLTLALVPVGRSHWRVVAFPNALVLAIALRDRQAIILDRVNEPLRDSIRVSVSIRDVEISREPLEEWERYAVHVRGVVENRGDEPVVLYSAHIVGPELSLGDTVGETLPQPITLAPKSTLGIAWRRPLRGSHAGPYDVAWRPSLYEIEIADVDLGGTPRSRVRLYSTWQDFIVRNPLPSRTTGGVLAWTDPR
ncbi:MAG TPA: hypothetical protein VJ802_07565 [Gemmatimonadaceae bacterium]|nr:hypothetical protein [Gemmatimonadaceae bacterium]